MSSLRERVEGLVANWRDTAISGTRAETAFALDKCATELAAALAAEGQGEATQGDEIFDSHSKEPEFNKWYEQYAHWDSTEEAYEAWKAAAAPSLHKEGRCNVGHPRRSDWRCDLPSIHGDEPHHYSEMDKPAALHKEGAGGAQEALCGTARNATTSMNEAGRRTAMDVSPSEELLSRPHRIASYSNQEELSAIVNAPEPNVNVLPDGTCEPAAAGTERALPLQRTLPDEQFKGAVVEAIGMEREERIWCMECGKSVSTPVPKDTIIRAWVECPECIEKRVSPAGRAEQP